MTPEDLTHLYSLSNEFRSIRYDVRNMRAFTAALGNPQCSFESVLIGGTNGKGSVASMLSAMLPAAGLYTSPHLVRLNERIRIGNAEISDSDLKEIYERAKEAASSAPGLQYPPTYFENVTAMAFLYFRDRVKFAILEVGLGGRLDATNVVQQRLSVITSIGLDHQQFLGRTLEEIAAEKAGIIKQTEPVVVGPDVDYAIVRERAGDRLITTSSLERSVRSIGSGRFEFDLRTPHHDYRSVIPSLPGRHQVDNAIVAMRAAECLGLDYDRIRQGVETARWPGRLEHFAGSPAFLLDGAHNPHAAKALASFLGEAFASGVWMIFSAMVDKDYEAMIDLCTPHVNQWILTRPDSPRAADPSLLRRRVPNGIIAANAREALAYSREHAPEGTTVVVCGSLYLIGEVRAMLE